MNAVAFIAGGAYANYLVTLTREQLREEEGRIALNYWIDLTMDEWLAQVTKLPSTTAVVYLAVTQDGTGKRLLPTDALTSITSRSASTMYSIVGNYIDYGIVGETYNPDALASEVAALATRILRGEHADDIPAVDSRSTVPTINRVALRRWGLSELRLPAGTVITHKEPSVWERYRWPLAGALSLLALQALLITGLVVQRARRRDSEERNAAVLRAMPDMMFLMTRDGPYIDYHAPDQSALLVKPEHFLGRRMQDVLPPHVACTFEDHFARLVPGQPPTVVEYRLQMPDGEREFEARIVPSQNGRVLAIVRDITERGGQRSR